MTRPSRWYWMAVDWALSRPISSSRRSNADRSPRPGGRTSRVSAAGDEINRPALADGTMSSAIRDSSSGSRSSRLKSMATSPSLRFLVMSAPTVGSIGKGSDISTRPRGRSTRLPGASLGRAATRSRSRAARVTHRPRPELPSVISRRMSPSRSGSAMVWPGFATTSKRSLIQLASGPPWR